MIEMLVVQWAVGTEFPMISIPRNPTMLILYSVFTAIVCFIIRALVCVAVCDLIQKYRNATFFTFGVAFLGG